MGIVPSVWYNGIHESEALYIAIDPPYMNHAEEINNYSTQCPTYGSVIHERRTHLSWPRIPL